MKIKDGGSIEHIDVNTLISYHRPLNVHAFSCQVLGAYSSDLRFTPPLRISMEEVAIQNCFIAF